MLANNNRLHHFIAVHPRLVEKIKAKAYSNNKLSYAQKSMYIKFLERVTCYSHQSFDTDWFHSVINENFFSWENRYPMVNCRNWYRKDWTTYGF